MNNKEKSSETKDNQHIFWIFKKLQLAIAGIVVALLLLNIMLSDDRTLLNAIGIDQEDQEQVTDEDEDEDVFSVSFFETFKD